MCQSLHGQNFLQYNCKLSQHYLKYLAFPAINPISGQISHNDTYYTFILNTAILFTSASFFYTHFSIALTYPPHGGYTVRRKKAFLCEFYCLLLAPYGFQPLHLPIQVQFFGLSPIICHSLCPVLLPLQ